MDENVWGVAFASTTKKAPAAEYTTVADEASGSELHVPDGSLYAHGSSPKSPSGASPKTPRTVNFNESPTSSATASSPHAGRRKDKNWSGRPLSSDERRRLRDMRVQRQRTKQIHWRARQPARRLTEAERKEIQSRLYAPSQTSRTQEPQARLHAGGAGGAGGSTSRGAQPPLAPRGAAASSALERANALDPSPSALGLLAESRRAPAEAAARDAGGAGKARRAKTSRAARGAEASLAQHGAASPDTARLAAAGSAAAGSAAAGSAACHSGDGRDTGRGGDDAAALGPDEVQQQLRTSLRTNHAKVLDLFRSWDTDGDGTITKKELRKAVASLGVAASTQAVDALFDSFDRDGGGSIEYNELHRSLMRAATGAPAGASAAAPSSTSTGAPTSDGNGAPHAARVAPASSAAAPSPRLPPGWHEAKSAEGHTYYYHGVSGQTSWDPPRLAGDHDDAPPTAPRPAGHGAKGRGTARSARTARTARETGRARTSRESGADAAADDSPTRRELFWNLDYKPTALGTAPIPVLRQPAEGWVGIGQRAGGRDMERRMADPSADIQTLGGTRAHSGKEAGPSRVVQQWKEGLRSIVPDPMTAEEAEVEQLRVLLRRGAGIGTPNDGWTPYTGPDETEVVMRQIADYLEPQVRPEVTIS